MKHTFSGKSDCDIFSLPACYVTSLILARLTTFVLLFPLPWKPVDNTHVEQYRIQIEGHSPMEGSADHPMHPSLS